MILNRASTLIVLSPNCSSFGVLTLIAGRSVLSLFGAGVCRRAKFSFCFSASFLSLFFLAFLVSLTAGAGVSCGLSLVIFYFLVGLASQFCSFLRVSRKSFIDAGFVNVGFVPQKAGLIGETFGVDC